MRYKTITFLSDLDPNHEGIYTYHDCTLIDAAKIFRDNNPGEKGVCLVHDGNEWLFVGYLKDILN